MNVYTDASLTIKKAASRARGDRFIDLIKLCEIQKSISTKRLLKIVDKLMESDRADAIHFKALADFISKHKKSQP